MPLDCSAGSRFRFAYEVELLKLATKIYSLSRVSRRNIRLRSTLLVWSVTTLSFEESLRFRAVYCYHCMISGTFHTPLGGLFTFPSRY